MRSVWDRLIHSGLTPDMPADKIHRIQLVSGVSILLTLAASPYPFVLLALHLVEPALVMAGSVLMGSLMFALSRSGRPGAARVGILLSSNATVAYFSIILGERSGVHETFLLMAAMAAVLYSVKERLRLALALAVPLALLWMVKTIDSERPAAIAMTSEQFRMFETLIQISVMAALTGLILHARGALAAAEQRLLESLRQEANQQRRLKEQNDQLAAASRFASVGEMAGNIAHEINTPLGAVLLSSQTIKDELSKPDPDLAMVTMMADAIEATTERIAKIVASLRSLTHRRSNIKPLPAKAVSVIEDVLLISSERLKIKGIRLECHVPRGLDPRVQIGEVELGQVLLQLLTNAADAVEVLPEAWIRVEVGAQGSRLAISVEDCGRMPPEVRGRIFTPLFTTKSVHGTGLGLTMCRSLLRSSGGDLMLDQESEHTRFVITVPMVANAGAQARAS
jgi:signal transduction histidine kinase